MKRFGWQIFLGLTLIALSIAFYLLHYTIFKDSHHIFIYMIGDVAFVFIEVLLVTLIIHQVLSMKERKSSRPSGAWNMPNPCLRKPILHATRIC